MCRPPTLPCAAFSGEIHQRRDEQAERWALAPIVVGIDAERLIGAGHDGVD